MKHTVFTLFLSTFFGLAHGAAADEPRNRTIADQLHAVVQLVSLTNRACGTGFISTDGLVVTNYHLAHSLCPKGACPDLTVRRAREIGAPATEDIPANSPRIVAAFPAFDAALLDVGLREPGLSFGDAGAVGDIVTTIGFPGCSRAAQSTGAIETIDRLHLGTSLRGSHGSSGAPILDRAGRVIGIVDEAGSLLDAAWSRLFGSDFSLRGERLDSIAAVRASPDPRISQLETLVAFYQELASASILTRLRGGMDFVVAGSVFVEAAGQETSPDDISVILRSAPHTLETPPALLVSAAASPARLTTEAFATAYSLENRSRLGAADALAQYHRAVSRRPGPAPIIRSPLAGITLTDIDIAAAAALLGGGLVCAFILFGLVRRLRPRA